jgi:hypothetical protein
MHKTIQNILARYIKNVFVAGRDLIILVINISEKKPGEKPKIWGMMKIAIINYILALFLDWLLFCPRREIRLSSKDLYIERTGGVGDLLLWYLLLAITLVGFYYIFSWVYKRMKIKSKQIGTGAICLGILDILCPIVIFLSYFMPIAKVDNITPITGRVPDPGYSYSYLYVRPFGSAQCWLQNPVPLQPDTDGKWRTLAHFGGITGMGYEILVINSGTKIDKFTHPGGYDCNDIPRDVKRFVRVVYHR